MNEFLFKPPYNIIEKSFFKNKKFVENLFLKSKVIDVDLYGTHHTYSLADRIHAFLSPYPTLADSIQEYLLKNYSQEEIIRKIIALLINKKFGSFNHDQLLNISLICLVLITSNGTLDSPIDIVEVEIKPSSQEVSLYFSDLIYLLPSKSIVLLIASFYYLIEELHLQDIFQYTIEDIKDILNSCNHEIPSQIWNVDGFIYNLLFRLGFEINSLETQNRSKILSHVCLSFIYELDLFKYYTDFFAIDKWNSLLNSKFNLNLSSNIPKNIFLNKVTKLTPIFSLNNNSGFRIIVGRSRNTGLGTVGINPAGILLLEYLKPGDQIILEDPFSSYSVQSVSTLNGPYVKLKSGSCLRLYDLDQLNNFEDQIDSIISLGDILIATEDIPKNFSLNYSGSSHYSWINILRQNLAKTSINNIIHVSKIIDIELKSLNKPKEELINDICYYTLEKNISAIITLELYKLFNIPIHPKWTPKWNKIKNSDWRILRSWVIKARYWEVEINDKKIIRIEGEPEDTVINLLKEGEITFNIEENKLSILEWGHIFYHLFLDKKVDIASIEPTKHILNPIFFLNSTDKIKFILEEKFRVNAALFSIGNQKSNFFGSSLSGFFLKPKSDNDIAFINKKINELKLNFSLEDISFLEHENITNTKDFVPESIEKILLRKKYKLNIFKDGLIHIPCLNSPLTEFNADEINVELSQLRQLGYYYDIRGNKLISKNQSIAIFPFDVIVPKMIIPHILNIMNFINDELKHIFNIENFYKTELNEKAIIGSNIIGINKNYTKGSYGRIIGFNNNITCTASPIWHLSKESTCNGDMTDSLVLDLDCFLNLNLAHIRSKRGVLRGIPLFTQIKPKFDHMNNYQNILDTYENKTYFNNSLRLVKINLFPLKNFKENLASNYNFMNETIESIDNITNQSFENKFEKILSKFEKLKVILKTNRIFKLKEIQKLFNHYIFSFFLTEFVSSIEKLKTNDFKCNSCNSGFNLPLFKFCLNCEVKIIRTNPFMDLEDDFRELMKFIDSNKQLNLSQNNKDLILYIKIQLESYGIYNT